MARKWVLIQLILSSFSFTSQGNSEIPELIRDLEMHFARTGSNDSIMKGLITIRDVADSGDPSATSIKITPEQLEIISQTLNEIEAYNQKMLDLNRARPRSGSNPAGMYRRIDVNLLKSDGQISDEELEQL